MNLFRIFALIGLIALAAFGLSQQRFDGDIFSLLPPDLEVVKALEIQQDSFSRKQELLISIRSEDPSVAEAAADSVSQILVSRSDVSRVIWREPGDEESGLESEMLAYHWLNANPDSVTALAERFEVEALEAHLLGVIERASASADPYEMAMLLGDPMGLLRSDGDQGYANQQAFTTSTDGKFRVIYVQPALPQHPDWFDQIQDAVEDWNEQQQTQITFRFAGNPAFFNEFSASLIEDLGFSVLATALCVALLFWFAHRQILPLLWMLSLLALVLLSAVSIGGLMIGTLNLISLGYAAVLMGLAADYGLILYQEHRSSSQSAAASTRIAGPSILWAALTTAAAFACISRGSLPGMTQLGLLVAIGVLLAAFTMLLFYLWPIKAEAKQPPADLNQRSVPAKLSVVASLALAVLAIAVIAVKPPQLDSSPDTLGPAQTDAFAAMKEIQTHLNRDESPLFLLFDAHSAKHVSQAFKEVAPVLNTAAAQGTIESWQLPTAVWPNTEHQHSNLDRLVEISAAKDRFVATAESLNIPSESQELTLALLGYFAGMKDRDIPITAASEQAAWLLNQALAANSERYLALGAIKLSSRPTKADALVLERAIAEIPSVTLAGWPLASPAILTTMKADLANVGFPMAVLLLTVLFLAFRSIKDVILSLCGLLLSLTALVAAMSILGWSFNLMSILALPLLLGVTVDYSVHIQMALKRNAGDRQKTHATVGKAILLAGATTSLAFATLGFADNEGLASFGKVSAVGVALACLFSVYLLPGCWQSVNRVS